MKQLPLFLLIVAVLALYPTVATAQHGTVVYQERIELDFELPPEMQHMRDQFPSEAVTDRELLFDGDLALTRAAEQEEEQLERPDRGGIFFFFGGGPGGQDNNMYFIDRSTNQSVEQREFFGRTFLIEDTLKTYSWRMTGEQATFLDYLTMQAIAQTSDTTSVEAWFTPQIPVSIGPFGYGGLPGLILVLHDGPRSYVAQSVETEAPEASLLQAPTRGSRMSADEFEAMIEERARQMGSPSRRR